MYLLFKYLRPREMSRQNIENFDAWASVFSRKTDDFTRQVRKTVTIFNQAILRQKVCMMLPSVLKTGMKI